MTASAINRMLPGSLAERHDAHQHSTYARRFQRDEKQAVEAVSHGAKGSRASTRYWITWSARSRSDGGIVRPSAFAVFMLITSSNFVGCSIGRSAGLAPLRILSA